MSPHPDRRLLFGQEELSRSERRELLEHLKSCPACREDVQLVAALSARRTIR